jgi:hypothetical protein
MAGPSTVVVDDASAIVAFRNGAGANGWRLDVVIDGSVLGHIDNGSGAYRYFEGPQNDITWSFAELELERLKARIRATVRAERQSD